MAFFHLRRPLCRLLEVSSRWNISKSSPLTFASKAFQEDIQEKARFIDNRIYRTDLYIKRTGRCSPSSLREILRLISSSRICNSNQALLLLRACGSLLSDLPKNKRSELLAQVRSTLDSISSVSFDVSHYNAILSVHNENSYPYDPSEFLSSLEKKGIAPNRVTYQHCIEKYCGDGNIEGAKAILEFMKESGLSVNEYVFHSLIKAHVRSGDVSSAKSLITDVMRDSGLIASSEAWMLFIVESLPPWEAILSLIQEAKASEIFFTDHEYFQLMVSLLKAKRLEDAIKVKSLLPFKSGYFQELRNAIPLMIYEGYIDLPYELLTDFSKSAEDGSILLSSGIDFFPQAMLRAGCDYPSVVDIITRLSPQNPSEIFSKVIMNCLDEENYDFGNYVSTHHRNYLVKKNFSSLIHFRVASLENRNGTFNSNDLRHFMNQLLASGIYLSFHLSSSFLPHLLPSGKFKNSSSLTNWINSTAINDAKISFSDVANATILYYLNQESESGFLNALKTLKDLITIYVRPISWKNSLARCYLSSPDNNLSPLLHFLFLCTKEQRHYDSVDESNRNSRIESSNELLASIHSLSPRFISHDSSPDEFLIPILKGMLETPGLTLSPNFVSQFEKTVENESVKDLLKSLALKSPSISLEEESDVLEKFNRALENNPVFNSNNSYVNFSVLHQELNRAINEEKDFEKALKILQKNSRIFCGTRHILHALVSHFMESNDFEKALSVLQTIQRPETELYIATLVKIIKPLKTAEEILSLFRTLPLDNFSFLGQNVENEFRKKLVSLPDSTESLKDFLISKGLLSKKPLVNEIEESLSRGDYSKALSVLEIHCSSNSNFKIHGSTLEKLLRGLFETGELVSLKGLLSSESPLDSTRFLSNEKFNCNLSFLFESNTLSLEDKLNIIDCLLSKSLLKDGSETYYSSLYSSYLTEKDMENATKLYFEAGDKNISLNPLDLLIYFGQKEDLESLQKIMDVKSKTSGESSSLYFLIHTCLLLGKNEQAKHLLDTPGLTYKRKTVEKIVNHLISVERLDALESFVLYSKNVFAVDREYLYDRLVSANRNDSEKSKEIWLRMQEEGFLPSLALKNKLRGNEEILNNLCSLQDSNELSAFLSNKENHKGIIEALNDLSHSQLLDFSSKVSEKIKKRYKIDYRVSNAKYMESSSDVFISDVVSRIYDPSFRVLENQISAKKSTLNVLKDSFENLSQESATVLSPFLFQAGIFDFNWKELLEQDLRRKIYLFCKTLKPDGRAFLTTIKENKELYEHLSPSVLSYMIESSTKNSEILGIFFDFQTEFGKENLFRLSKKSLMKLKSVVVNIESKKDISNALNNSNSDFSH